MAVVGLVGNLPASFGEHEKESGFRKFVETHGDRVFTVPRGQAKGLDTLLATTKTKLTLTLPPEQIVFQEE